jgi:hypothetical protein
MQAYSDPSRESDPHALPDVEVFQLTAEEVAESSQYEDERNEFNHLHQFRLAAISPPVHRRMIAAMIAELGITGGWYYWFCFPGCMPDSDPIGPFATADDAKQAAQEQS